MSSIQHKHFQKERLEIFSLPNETDKTVADNPAFSLVVNVLIGANGRTWEAALHSMIIESECVSAVKTHEAQLKKTMKLVQDIENGDLDPYHKVGEIVKLLKQTAQSITGTKKSFFHRGNLPQFMNSMYGKYVLEKHADQIHSLSDAIKVLKENAIPDRPLHIVDLPQFPPTAGSEISIDKLEERSKRWFSASMKYALNRKSIKTIRIRDETGRTCGRTNFANLLKDLKIGDSADRMLRPLFTSVSGWPDKISAVTLVAMDRALRNKLTQRQMHQEIYCLKTLPLSSADDLLGVINDVRRHAGMSEWKDLSAPQVAQRCVDGGKPRLRVKPRRFAL